MKKFNFNISFLLNIFSLTKDHIALLILGLTFLAIGSTINLILPLFIKSSLNQYNQTSNFDTIIELSIYCILIFVAQGLAFFYRHKLFFSLGYKIGQDLRSKLYSNIINKKLEFFGQHSGGDLVNRIILDVDQIQRSFSTTFSVFIRYGFQVIGGVVLALTISIKLTLLCVLVIPILGVSIAICISKLKKIISQMQIHLGRINSQTEETITNISTIKSFYFFEPLIKRFDDANDQATLFGIKRANYGALISSSSVFIIHASLSLIILYGGFLVKNGDLNIGDLISFILYGLIVAISFGLLAGSFEDLTHTSNALNRTFEILNNRDEEEKEVQKIEFNRNSITKFSIENLSFSHSKNELILENINLNFNLNSINAVIGPSGSGKSTLCHLLLNLYQPTTGAVCINSTNVNEIKLQSLSGIFGYIPQKVELFTGTIADNFRIINPDLTDSRIEDLLAQVNLQNFIKDLPNGINTQIGEKGIAISGGERQRIAIARALINDPKILILDEATSALDSENETIIINHLKSISDNRIIIICTHNLNLIQTCDQIIVLKNGSISELGTHNQLLENNGLYKALLTYKLMA